METQGFEELVRRAQAGDREAMDRVLEMLRPYLSRIAGPYVNPLRPVDSTADLLQESCLRAWHKIGSFQGGKGDEHTFEMFRSWIGQIVRRLGKDAAAEPHLLYAFEGYDDLFGMGAPMTRKTAQELVTLYTAWEKPEKAAEYQRLLDAPVAAEK